MKRIGTILLAALLLAGCAAKTDIPNAATAADVTSATWRDIAKASCEYNGGRKAESGGWPT